LIGSGALAELFGRIDRLKAQRLKQTVAVLVDVIVNRLRIAETVFAFAVSLAVALAFALALLVGLAATLQALVADSRRRSSGILS
jgi:hypothetical protein